MSLIWSLHRRGEIVGGRKSRRRYIQKGWKICQITFSRIGAHGAGMGGRGTWSGRGGRWSPWRITPWGRIVVSFGMCLSGTPYITQTITWSWVASAAPYWGNNLSTLRGASAPPPSDHQPHQRGRTDSMQTYGGPPQSLRNLKYQGNVNAILTLENCTAHDMKKVFLLIHIGIKFLK